MMASTPWACSHSASSTVVALDSTLAPQARTRASNWGEGRPKWKLTTGGRNGSTRSAISSLKGLRPGPVAMLAGSMPCSA